MAYDTALAQRVRQALGRRAGVREIKMMGGLCFMLRGHMCCRVVRDDLVVRVGLQQYDEALAEPHARPMDFTGRPLRGMVYVSPGGLRPTASLRRWINRAVRFASSLPRRT